jgi:type II restriction/modification system DNA methylase subunit YeeA
MPLSPSEFAAKWAGSERSERAASQEHFIDICQMLGVQTPNEADPTGDWYAFEKGAEKLSIDDPDAEDGDGFADVWKKNHFAWEYKGKKKNLDIAYKQLLRYRESLENPPLLVVCDLDRFEVHTNFTGTIKQKVEFDLEALKTDPAKWLRVLRSVFTAPDELRPEVSPERLTEHAAEQFVKLADQLRGRNHDPHSVAHFLSKLLFCLFAEDAGLLPSGILQRLADNHRLKPDRFTSALQDLFGAMAKGGGSFGVEVIEWFNGGLFDSDEVLPLETDEIDLLRWVGVLDWAQIEPAIFGTLFERLLDPEKRGQLGAHYTDKAKIDKIVEPVLLAPIRREFEKMKRRVIAKVEERQRAVGEDVVVGGKLTKVGRSTGIRPRKREALPGEKEFREFLTHLRSIRVLDPACGSGNFLYVALRGLKDLEHEVILWGSLHLGLAEFPEVGPQAVMGIEINEYAAELARVTIWIGQIQWMMQNGYSYDTDPILKPLDNIQTRDALLDFTDDGVSEVAWPEADVIIGNPPFLGAKLLRRGLGSDYVDELFRLFKGRVPGMADLVIYWHEKARAMVAESRTKRVGLIATQNIRGGASRQVLQAVKESGDIFMAWSDEPWAIEGAAVNVSIVGFDDGSETERSLDGVSVPSINSNLTVGTDVTAAVRLPENHGIAFIADVKGGPFDIPESLAKKMLASPNPDGRKNSDVVRPWINGLDITRRPRNMWIIDFGVGMSIEQAALYEAPFEYIKTHVKPMRDAVRRKRYRELWWLHVEPGSGMRKALDGLERFIVTPTLAKHRLFDWVPAGTLADHQLVAIARDDDYTFGVLHSAPHEVWALARGTQLETRPRYTPTTTFETFPFPRATPEQQEEIASIAAELHERRTHWLNPPDIGGGELKSRTLTNLYNMGPEWLQQIHARLDVGVLRAYGWSEDLSKTDMLGKLLDLNVERAGAAASQLTL